MLRLDRNESPYNRPLSHYPDDDLSLRLAKAWGATEGIPPQCILWTFGSEHALDLLMRTYAGHAGSTVVSVTPTRSVYARVAEANDVRLHSVPLAEPDFAFTPGMFSGHEGSTSRMAILCSPASPTGLPIAREALEAHLSRYRGMTVVDESYVDYCPEATCLPLLNHNDRLFILRSFSHAWASAGLRLACILAHPERIAQLKRYAYSYPISTPVYQEAMRMVGRRYEVDRWVSYTLTERAKVACALRDLSCCEQVYPSSTCFLFVKMRDAAATAAYLLKRDIRVKRYGNFLRITIGLPHDNSALIGALRQLRD